MRRKSSDVKMYKVVEVLKPISAKPTADLTTRLSAGR